MLDKIKEFIELRLDIDDISIKSRKRKHTYPRALFYRIAKDTTKYSLETIGSHVGRGHCEVLNAFKGTFPQAYSNEHYIKELYDDYMINYNKVKDIDLLNEKTTKELIIDNLNLKKEIKILQAKKECEDKDIIDLVFKYNNLSDENKELFLLRTDAILKMMR